jgi:hypothetical protein
MWWTLIGAAAAADLTVGPDPGADFATFGDAALAAVPGDRLLISEGTYRTDPVVLDGVEVVGTGPVAILPYADAIFTGPLLTLRGVTALTDVELRGRSALHLVTVESGTATLTRVGLQNGAAEDGGNLRVASGAHVDLIDSSLTGGIASNRGGGMFLQGSAVIRGTSFEGNSALTGGGLKAAVGSTLELYDSLFFENSVSGILCSGGGLHSEAAGALISGARFEANTSGFSAAGADVLSPATILDSDFVENIGALHAGLDVRGLAISQPSEARRLRFCGNTSSTATGFAAAFRANGAPLVASNILLYGSSDAFSAINGADVELGFTTWIGQFAADGTPGSAARAESNASVTVSNSLIQEALGQPFSAANGSTLQVSNVRTHLVGTPPAGSTPADPMFAVLGACDWPVPLNDAVRDALPSIPDVDGTPGAIGSTGGPFGPEAVFPDGDGDGWGDRREELEGTNPLDPDTDGDGAADSVDPRPIPQAPPTPGTPPDVAYGFGCSTAGRTFSGSAGLALFALTVRRRRPNR